MSANSPLWISLKTAGLATIAVFFTGIVAAYWMLNYRGRWKSVIESIFVSPLILPPTVVGFILLLLFGKNGPLGQLTAVFDFTVVFTWYGAAIAPTVKAAPTGSQDYHVQVEIFKQKWQAIKDCPFPWYVRFDPLSPILMV